MRHHQFEQWAADNGYGYEYLPKIHLKDIYVDDKIRTNIRLQVQLNQEHVERYAQSVRDGAEFPALVVCNLLSPHPGKTYEMVDGMHRAKAFESVKKLEHDVYLVASRDPLIIDEMRRTINVNNGYPYPMEEALAHAIYLKGTGRTAKDVSRMMHLPAGRLEGELKRINTKDRLRLLGVPLVTRDKKPSLKVSMLDTLHLITRDAHMAAAARIMMQGQLSAQQARDLALELRDAKSDHAGDLILEEWRSAHSKDIERGHGGMVIKLPTCPLLKVPSALRQLDKLLVKEGIQSMTPQDLSNIVAAMRSSCDNMKKFVVDLKL